MGQAISMIISKEVVEISDDIVHFIDNGFLVIPLDLSGSSIEILIETFLKYDDLETLFLCEHSLSPELGYVMNLIQLYALENIALIHESSWADIPVDSHSLYIVDKKILKKNQRAAFNAKQRMKINIFSESRYHDYDSSKSEYDKLKAKNG